jgi:hypothetical protein
VIGLVNQLANVAPGFAKQALIVLGSSNRQSLDVDD